MARLAVLSSLLLALSAIPAALAGPACARKHHQAKNCVEICKAKWGWSKNMMGTDRWGSVINKVEADAWDTIIAQACGLSVASAPTATALSVAATPTIIAQPGPPIGAASDPAESVPPLPTSLSLPIIPSVISSIISVEIPPAVRTTSRPTTRSTHPVVVPTSSRYIPTDRPAPAPTTTRARPTQAPPATTPKTNPGSGSGSGSGSSDIQAYLIAHNNIRANHGASPLVWSDELAGKAQQWANGCRFQHSGGSLGQFGENLAAGTGSSYGIAEAVKSWTDEVGQYNGNNPDPSHFTQVVWKGSQQLGCAVQDCDGIFPSQQGKARYYVCEYFPAGNVIGRFAQNVQV